MESIQNTAEAKEWKRHLVTAALPYANGPVHIGHLAGVYLPADIYVRYLRMQGEDVKFICGSDEHGVAITIKAQKEGLSPQELVDKYHGIIKNSLAEFGVSFDIYSRTSNDIHKETAQEFFRKVEAAGKLEVKTSEQFYDESAQQFLADRYIQGTCPKCGHPDAYGDQCENCGSTLSPTELINPRSMLSGNAPVLKETSHWYLPLQEYEEWLKEYILQGHKEWKTNVYGQCKSWIDAGLQARAVTRDLNWGVPVPLEGAEGKMLYVWFDAPIGYISATRELLPNSWELYWKNEDTRLVHFIGKDNIVFHCIIFPVMLKAKGDYILPDNVPANEFLNLEGQKISTSRNWAVWLHEYLLDFPGKQDVLRYVLTANAPETKDNDFTWKDFAQRNNSELVAILGNFVNRAFVLTQKYFESKVPAAIIPYEQVEFNLYEAANEAIAQIEDSLSKFRFREAMASAMELARIGNKYLADAEPWKRYATNPEKTADILHHSLQLVAKLSVVLEPFLPFTAQKLRDALSMDSNLDWQAAKSPMLLAAETEIKNMGLLFEKIEDSTVQAQIDKLEATKQANQMASKNPEPLKDTITFDDFAKMDIRVGRIIEAEAVPKAKKLLKLTIDTGVDVRTVVSGIAEHFKPEDIVGKQVSVLVNLAPRDLRGITSNGMILMAEDKDGSLKFVSPTESVWNGATVK